VPQEEGHRGEGPAPFGLVGAGSGVGSVAGAKNVCGVLGNQDVERHIPAR